MDQKKIEDAFFEVINALGELENKKELEETPTRIANSYKEIFSGIGKNPKEILTKTFEVSDKNIVIEKNITFYSMCEHHFLPFFGEVSIAYIPNGKIFGFGDIVKLVEILSRRPQIQERLTAEIAKYMYEILNCEGVYVHIKAKHLCMSMRGANKENASIITTGVKGSLEKDNLKRMEIINLLK